MGQVFDGFDVGHIYGHFVALVDFELRDAVRRRNGSHVYADFVALADDFGGFFQLDTVFFRLFHSVLPEPWVFAVPGFFRVDFGSGNQTQVMRFGKGRVVVYQAHFVAGNVDQLVAFRFQRAGVEEAVFGEFVQRHQPFAVGFLGFAHGRMVVAGLVVDVEFLFDRIHFFAFVGFDGVVDVPFDHLAVDKQRGVGVATAVKRGV